MEVSYSPPGSHGHRSNVMHMCLYEVKQIDCCSRTRYDPLNNYIMAVQSMLDLEGAEGAEATAGTAGTEGAEGTAGMEGKVLEVLEGVICVLELLEDVRRVLEAVEICALYAVG